MRALAGKAVVAVVEDDASMSRALERILRLAGFDVVLYASAEAALAGTERQAIDCLIVDVQLPGSDGFALHAALAARGPTAPCVFISAFGERDARARVAGLERARFMQKPFAGREMLATIRRLLEAPSPHRPFDA